MSCAQLHPPIRREHFSCLFWRKATIMLPSLCLIIYSLSFPPTDPFPVLSNLWSCSRLTNAASFTARMLCYHWKWDLIWCCSNNGFLLAPVPWRQWNAQLIIVLLACFPPELWISAAPQEFAVGLLAAGFISVLFA